MELTAKNSQMNIKSNIINLRNAIPDSCTIVAVSKTNPPEKIKEAYDAGQRIFGENRVQEMTPKYEVLPKDIQWHMIGHVQTNKVKFMAEYVSLIHGVDSLKLLQEINKQGKKHHRVIDCLLQIHIAEEETKFGLDEKELHEIFDFIQNNEGSMKNIRILGLMGMATFTDNQEQIRKEFTHLKSIFDTHQNLKSVICNLQSLSMGMSGDYKAAIECGSTMIRVGSSIFGNRN